MLLALGVLAMTVGLIRSETAGDLRTLTAAGASSGMRRKLTAATAGTLALLGVVLGVTAAYLALIGAYSNNLDRLGHVPLVDLAVTALGVPVLAAAAGWLLAGRQPPAIARAALD
jgi:putative ABC transport system permease protein